MPLDARRILIPITESSHSEHAFRWACHMAKDAKADLLALHVIEMPLSMSLAAEVTEDINRAEKLLSRYEQIAKRENRPRLQARCVRARQAGAAITREAEIENVDLVIIGISFHRNLGSYHLGTTGSYVFQHAACEVLLWREPRPINGLAEI